MMVVKMYVTLMPVILGGVANMVFTKTGIYKKWKRPIDGGNVLNDGRRILGDNKTWIGFAGMSVFCAVIQVIWGMFCKVLFPEWNYLYLNHTNTWTFNLWIGFLFGFAYMLCELPNSFIKRRLDIYAGKSDSGISGAIFFLIDQIDSLLGVVLVLAVFYPMPLWQYVLFIVLGAVTHVAVNSGLILLRVRKNL